MRVYEKISSLKEKLQKLKQNIKSRQKGQTFHFSPFSRKQKQVLTWWCKDSPVHDKDGIIADGAIRSGKTVSMSLSFVMWAMSTFNGQNFAMCGKTIGSFRRNVLFWLKLMLKSRGYSVTDRRADNLIIIRKGDTENYFYIFGGKDERSQDLIQGITLAGVFFDISIHAPARGATSILSKIHPMFLTISHNASSFSSFPFHSFLPHLLNSSTFCALFQVRISRAFSVYYRFAPKKSTPDL